MGPQEPRHLRLAEGVQVEPAHVAASRRALAPSGGHHRRGELERDRADVAPTELALDLRPTAWRPGDGIPG